MSISIGARSLEPASKNPLEIQLVFESASTKMKKVRTGFCTILKSRQTRASIRIQFVNIQKRIQWTELGTYFKLCTI